MKANANKLQALTVAAILILISGGIAAYAQDQNATSTSSTTGSSSSDSTTTSAGSTSSTTSTVTTSTSSTSTTTTAPATLCTPPGAPAQPGRLVLPIGPSQGQTGSIVFSGDRGCVASITSMGGVFSVETHLRYSTPLTEYSIVLVANGTSHTLGNLVTGRDGAGQSLNQALLTPGTYIVSIQVFDTSTNPGQSTLVMQSGSGTIVSPAFPTGTGNPQGAQGDDHEGDSDGK